MAIFQQGPTFGTITKVIEESSVGDDQLLNWSVVRVLGELQVLSRASYTMLVVVPIVAALWSTIRNYSLLVNESIEVMIGRLSNLTGSFQVDEQTLDLAETQIPGLPEQLQEIADLSETITGAITTDSGLSEALPLIWILTFFAALAAVFAQLIYQAFAPSLVRRASKREFIGEVIEEESKLRSTDTALKTEHVEDLILKLNTQYVDAANSRNIACSYSAFFYGVAVLLVIWILGIQTHAVLSAGDII